MFEGLFMVVAWLLTSAIVVMGSVSVGLAFNVISELLDRSVK